MASLKNIIVISCFSLLLSTEFWMSTVTAMHHNNNRGNSGIEMLLAAGILAKLLNKHHGHHQSHPIPIPIPVPVHHGGGHHEVVHHGHHDHHGHHSQQYYDYAPYAETYYAAPTAYMPAYYK
ncbi:uncharacterized protein CDAR_226241 [Caerostris darwini]|uniref:Uncharacterized protein n=1 Tax=Caerostris darwini TaxID=1538125 RepID=A0AAV4ULM2_9ARAC|nr:uncharacterized protein CDAR_226241 [Caerostris darwini]